MPAGRPGGFRGRGLRKLLMKRLWIPRRVVHPLLSGVKRAAHPEELRVRRELAAGLGADSRAAAQVPDAAGYASLPAGALPGAEAAAARCREIYERVRADAKAEPHVFNPRKRYLLALLSGSDFARHPDLVAFMVSRPVLDTATGYLGAVPLLAGAALWWTPRNDSAERSQLFHFDGEDDRQLKLVLNVTETGPHNGPFTLLPADRSAPLRSDRGLRRRIPDAEVDAACGLEHAVSFEGPPGSGGFVDTSRCLHFGSRLAEWDRVVLMIQFLRFDCPTESTFGFDPVPTGVVPQPDRHQRLALGAGGAGS